MIRRGVGRSVGVVGTHVDGAAIPCETRPRPLRTHLTRNHPQPAEPNSPGAPDSPLSDFLRTDRGGAPLRALSAASHGPASL